MKNNYKLQELKKYLKSAVKNRLSINEKNVIKYLMLGFLGISTLTYSAWEYVGLDYDKGTVGDRNRIIQITALESENETIRRENSEIKEMLKQLLNKK